MKPGQKRKKPPAPMSGQGKQKKVEKSQKKAETPKSKTSPNKRPAPKDRTNTPTSPLGDNLNCYKNLLENIYLVRN